MPVLLSGCDNSTYYNETKQPGLTVGLLRITKISNKL